MFWLTTTAASCFLWRVRGGRVRGELCLGWRRVSCKTATRARVSEPRLLYIHRLFVLTDRVRCDVGEHVLATLRRGTVLMNELAALCHHKLHRKFGSNAAGWFGYSAEDSEYYVEGDAGWHEQLACVSFSTTISSTFHRRLLMPSFRSQDAVVQKRQSSDLRGWSRSP